MDGILSQLQNIGISSAESKVYVTLLKLGNVKAGQIIPLVDLSSSNVHEALEKLSKKGLISFIMKNGIKEYSPSDPENLHILIEKEKQDLNKKEENLKVLLKEMKSIQKLPEISQNAEVYLGFNGLKSAFRKLLLSNQEKREYIFFYKYDEKDFSTVHEFFSKLDIEGYYAKIPTRGIFSTEYRKLFKERKNHIQGRFTDQAIPSSINICGKKVLIISWNEKPVAFLIESSEISVMFKDLFEEVWNQASK